MKKRTGFDIIAKTILILVTLFLATSMAVVVIGGIPFLGKAIRCDETLFALRLSLITASISTILCFLLAIPSGYALTKCSMPFAKTIQTILELPLSLPNLVLGMCMLIVFSTNFGKTLKLLGFRVVFDTKGIIIAQTVVNLPLAIRIIRTAFLEVDGRLELIAGTLGASKWKRFLTITLPLSRRAILAAAILIWSRALGEFGATLMLVGATRMKTETLPASIYLYISTGENGMAMASAILLMALSFLSITLTNYLNRTSKERGHLRYEVY